MLNGEEFTHVAEAKVYMGGAGGPTYSTDRLTVYRAPSSELDLPGYSYYSCVIRKSDWPEAMPAKFGIAQSNWIRAVTPRGQKVRIEGYDIDHWKVGTTFDAVVWE